MDTFVSLFLIYSPLNPRLMLLTTTKDGYLVYDRYHSHLHKEAIPFLGEALERIATEGKSFLIEEVTFDCNIGFDKRVETTEEDEILFAQRINRNGLTRFVRHRQPEPCNSMVVVLMRATLADTYVLITAYVGRRGLVEPWDWASHVRTCDPIKSYHSSVEFWKSHALVWEEECVVQGTETVHPWH